VAAVRAGCSVACIEVSWRGLSAGRVGVFD
jgi:hypothetical protein